MKQHVAAMRRVLEGAEPKPPTRREIEALTRAYAIYKAAGRAGSGATASQQQRLYAQYAKALDRVLSKLQASALSDENQRALDAKADAWLQTQAIQGAGKWW